MQPQHLELLPAAAAQQRPHGRLTALAASASAATSVSARPAASAFTSLASAGSMDGGELDAVGRRQPMPTMINVPRGATAGAVMVVEDVTVQAGDRDLLTVSHTSSVKFTCKHSTGKHLDLDASCTDRGSAWGVFEICTA